MGTQASTLQLAPATEGHNQRALRAREGPDCTNPPVGTWCAPEPALALLYVRIVNVHGSQLILGRGCLCWVGMCGYHQPQPVCI